MIHFYIRLSYKWVFTFTFLNRLVSTRNVFKNQGIIILSILFIIAHKKKQIKDCRGDFKNRYMIGALYGHPVQHLI